MDTERAQVGDLGPQVEQSPARASQRPAVGAAGAASDQAWRPVDGLAAAALGLIAFVLRVPQLGAESLWHDDAWVALVSRVGWADVPTVSLTAPGFSYFVKGWFEVVGFGDLAAQIPAFVFGVLAPPLLYAVLRGRVRRPIAVGAGLVLALAPEHIVYSGRLKQYTLEVVLSLLVVWCTLIVIERPGRHRAWAALVAVGVVGVLVSFVMSLVVSAAAGAALLAAFRAGRTARFVAGVAVAVLGAVVVLEYVLHVRHVRTDGLTAYWRDQFVELDSASSVVTSLVGLLGDFVHGTTHLPALLAAAIVLPPMVALVLTRPLSALATFGPLAGLTAMSALELAPLGGGRTDLFVVGPLLVGVAIGAEELLDRATNTRGSRWVNVVAGVGGAALVVAGVVWYEVPDYPQMETRELVELVEAQRRPGDAVLVFFPARFAYGLYSDAELAVSRRPTAAQYHLTFPEPHLFLGYDAGAAAGYGDRVWMLASSLQRPGYPEFKAALESEHGLVPIEMWTRPGAELILYESP